MANLGGEPEGLIVTRVIINRGALRFLFSPPNSAVAPLTGIIPFWKNARSILFSGGYLNWGIAETH